MHFCFSSTSRQYHFHDACQTKAARSILEAACSFFEAACGTLESWSAEEASKGKGD
jgi:hypothetical protein